MTQRNHPLPVLLTTLAVLLAPSLAFAQGGCVNSPENPTAVLALVGAAGTIASSIYRRNSPSINGLKNLLRKQRQTKHVKPQ